MDCGCDLRRDPWPGHTVRGWSPKGGRIVLTSDGMLAEPPPGGTLSGYLGNDSSDGALTLTVRPLGGRVSAMVRHTQPIDNTSLSILVEVCCQQQKLRILVVGRAGGAPVAQPLLPWQHCAALPPDGHWMTLRVTVAGLGLSVNIEGQEVAQVALPGAWPGQAGIRLSGRETVAPVEVQSLTWENAVRHAQVEPIPARRWSLDIEAPPGQTQRTLSPRAGGIVVCDGPTERQSGLYAPTGSVSSAWASASGDGVWGILHHAIVAGPFRYATVVEVHPTRLCLRERAWLRGTLGVSRNVGDLPLPHPDGPRWVRVEAEATAIRASLGDVVVEAPFRATAGRFGWWAANGRVTLHSLGIGVPPTTTTGRTS